MVAIGAARRAAVVLVLGMVVAGSGGLSGQEPQGADQGVRAKALVIEHNGAPITDWLQLKPTDSVTLTVRAVDAQGNNVPITGFELWVWDQRVLQVASSSVQSSQAVVVFQPRERGQTTIQVRASGVRQWVLIHLTETVLAISPGREAPGPTGAGWRTWTAGGRLNLMTYNFGFQGDTTFAGKIGVLAEVYGGLEWSSGFALVGQFGLGSLTADSVTQSMSVSLVELSIRGQYSFMRYNKVRPVVEFGGGLYRARSGSVGQGIWNASFFFLGGAGVDATFTPRIIGEFRIGNRQQFEWTSSHANGHVASLFYFGAGVRARF
jgi:hypothetical protein